MIALSPNMPSRRPRELFVAYCLLITGVYLGRVVPSLASATVDWRESDVLIVGRNLCRGDGSLWMPRINAGGMGNGVTGMEFPILDQVGALLACGGDRQVVGARLLTLLLALVGIASVAVLAIRHLTPIGAGITVAGFALSPIVLFYGRATQPDVPSAALALLSVLLLDLALAAGQTRWWLYFGSACAMALGALIKLPALVYGLPLVHFVWSRRGVAALGDWRCWLYLPIALLPPALWYAHARDLQRTEGIVYFNLGSSWTTLLADWSNPKFYQRLFVQQLFDTYASPLISGVALAALVLRWRRMPPWMPLMALAAVVFLFLGGWVAAWHWCYGIMAVAPLALAAGFGGEVALARVANIRLRWALAALLVLSTACYGISRTAGWLSRPEESWAFADARRILDEKVPLGQRVVVFSDGDPKALWYLDRKGWVVGGSFELPRAAAGLTAVLDVKRLKLKGLYGEARQVVERGRFHLVFEDAVVEVWLAAEE